MPLDSIATVKGLLPLIEERLAEAASLAKAACSCADAGNIEGAVKITLDTEQLLYEATTLLNAISLVNRIGRS